MFIAPTQIVIDITHETYQFNIKSELLHLHLIYV